VRGLIARLWQGGATLAAPGLRAMLRRRVALGKEVAARLPEREGIDPMPRPAGLLVWLHAASVGESQSILPVLSALHSQAPDASVLLTTGTVSSAALLAEQLPRLGLGRVLHRFVPLDVPAWVMRFLDHWRPDVAGFVESELWPNLIAGCQARGIPMMLVNARMSARSLRGWQRVPGFARQVVGAFDRVQAQSEADAGHLRLLGARHVDAPGNLKLAAPPLRADPAELARLRALIGDRPVWLAASTHPGEEDVAGQVHRALAAAHPGLLTVVAPRHPERGAAAAAALGAPRRAAGQDPDTGIGGANIWVADTLGELGLLYRLAPLAFVGRSLTGQGGQNPLEPARLGCAVAVGPYTANFAEAVQTLEAAGALTRVADAGELAHWVDAMLRDPGRRRAAGAAACAAAQGAAGLPERTAAALLSLAHR
jgi:3-deoxy-D-manno-octulosonic-acid transferase